MPKTPSYLYYTLKPRYLVKLRTASIVERSDRYKFKDSHDDLSSILIHASQIKARGLLDSGSSTSFVSQRLVQSLGLPKSSKKLQITGIAGISHNSPLHSISTFHISPTFSPDERTLSRGSLVHSLWHSIQNGIIYLDWISLTRNLDVLFGVDICAYSGTS